MDVKLVLSATQVEELITRGFEAENRFFCIDALAPGKASLRMPFQKWMRRPGNVISGPALFTAADIAMYALVLAHMGPAMMAVTSNLNLHFLNKGLAADIYADAEILKLGRKQLVMEVRLRSGDSPLMVAQATGTYSVPSKPASG